MAMRQGNNTCLFHGVLAPVLSLDELSAGIDPATGLRFDVPDDVPGVEEKLTLDQRHAAVHRFVADLPSRDQELIERLFWQDETQTAIATSLGVSKMAISKAFARIYKRGRTALAAHQDLRSSTGRKAGLVLQLQ
jgi:DNA-directed RNA polymerase specialized sigma subunit